MQSMRLTLIRTKNYLDMLANTDKHTNHYLMQLSQNARKMSKKDKLVKRGRVSTDGHKWGVDGHRWKGGHRQAGK